MALSWLCFVSVIRLKSLGADGSPAMFLFFNDNFTPSTTFVDLFMYVCGLCDMHIARRYSAKLVDDLK